MNLKNYLRLSLLIVSVNFFDGKTQNWTDISSAWIASQGMNQGTTSYNIGCGGVVANRLTGDITIKFTNFGLWRTSDQGSAFVRIDQNTVGGRCESAWALQCDQDDPRRMASFSLDGTAAYTPDGVTWKKWTDRGRNWDLGAVDWSSANPKVIFAARHEFSGALELSKDGGATWSTLSVTADMQNNTSGVMLGVIDSTTLLYSNKNGINRSTDQGKTWAQVSTAVARNKVAVMFNGVCYVGTTTGLLVSKDKGATWSVQGSSIDILQGPQFGADENTMVIVNANGMYKSTDAGTTWNLITGLASGTGQYSIKSVTWFGCYVWDPVYNTCYATAISNPANKKYLGVADAIPPSAPTNVTATKITSTGCTVSWTASTDNLGVVLYEIFQSGASPVGTTTTTSFNVTGLTPSTSYTIQVKAVDAAGNLSSSGSVNMTTAKDTVPPTAPANVAATNITSSGCTVSWTASTDNIGVVLYEIYKSGVSIGTTATTSFSVTGLSPLVLYPIVVKAKDAAGNYSEGGTVNVTPKDMISPTPPKKVISYNVTPTSCTVSWNASTDDIGVVSYVVYRSGDSIGITETTEFVVSGLQPSTLYQIMVKAKDAAGNYSMSSGVVVTTKGAGINTVDSNPVITVYPNPASDFVLISVPDGIPGAAIISNASGAVVAEMIIQTNTVRIDVSSFPKGFYVVRIYAGDESWTRSFFIQ